MEDEDEEEEDIPATQVVDHDEDAGNEWMVSPSIKEMYQVSLWMFCFMVLMILLVGIKEGCSCSCY